MPAPKVPPNPFQDPAVRAAARRNLNIPLGNRVIVSVDGGGMRGILALQLLKKVEEIAGAPVYQLLGGASRDSIRTYNTCYDHVYDFNAQAGKLAEDLLESGIRAMKIWPFDRAALRNRGQFLTKADLL